MITPSGNGWLTTLADLSIILFMVTAADLSNARVEADAPESASAMIATSEPVAVFRPDAAAMPLGDWLAEQAGDPRQHLTIVVRYGAGGMEGPMDQALALAQEAERAGRPARIISEQGDRNDITVVLAYDANPQAMARSLLDQENRIHPKESQ